MRKTPEERFFEKVREANGCWVWVAYIDRLGYSRFGPTSGHRWSWKNFIGDIPPGLELDHLCRNRACVNPDHLEPVTRAENIRRGSLSYGGRDLCKAGLHDISDPENWTAGRRQCRECARKNWREYRRRMRAKAA